MTLGARRESLAPLRARRVGAQIITWYRSYYTKGVKILPLHAYGNVHDGLLSLFPKETK